MVRISVVLYNFDEVSAGEIVLAIEGVFPVEVFQINCQYIFRGFPQTFFNFLSGKGLIEVDFAKNRVFPEVADNFLLRQLLAVYELRMQFLLRVLLAVFDGSHDLRLVGLVENTHHFYFLSRWVLLSFVAHQSPSGEIFI